MSAVTPSSRPISSATRPFSTRSTVVPVKSHLAAGRRRQRAGEKIVEGRTGVDAAADPATDDVIALGDEIGGAAEAQVRERRAESGR